MLFIALIVLIAMTLAGIAMMRQVGTGLGIAGNLAFRQGAVSAADKGIELGIDWLTNTVSSSPTQLDNDQTFSNGAYFSSWNGGMVPAATFDPIKYFNNPFTAPGAAGPMDAAGNTVYFVIHRMCQTANLKVNDGNQKCITVQETIGTGSSTTSANYNNQQLTSSDNPYYRVTAYTVGPRGTTSYVQVIVKAG